MGNALSTMPQNNQLVLSTVLPWNTACSEWNMCLPSKYVSSGASEQGWRGQAMPICLHHGPSVKDLPAGVKPGFLPFWSDKFLYYTDI